MQTCSQLPIAPLVVCVPVTIRVELSVHLYMVSDPRMHGSWEIAVFEALHKAGIVRCRVMTNDPKRHGFEFEPINRLLYCQYVNLK